MFLPKFVDTQELKLLNDLGLVKKIEPILKQLFEQKIDIQTASQDIQTLIGSELKKQQQDIFDEEINQTSQKLGFTLSENQTHKTAVDFVLDSVSIRTTFEEELKKLGIIFCPISKAVINYPDLVKKYLNTVVAFSDNFFACLNSAVFSDGTFVYIPKGVISPMELSTYFRINSEEIGQFERTLIIAEEGSYVSYLEGCTAPIRSKNQLHAAVVELVALDNATIKYSTVQNWYPGNNQGQGGIYNFVTKRGLCLGKNSKISWTQVETGSAITWKYPSVVLKGDYSQGDFYSIAVTKNYQQADTGSKMTHIGKHTKSHIISKSFIQDNSTNNYRGLVKMTKNSDSSRNYTKCDSIILSKDVTYKNKKMNIKWDDIKQLLDTIENW